MYGSYPDMLEVGVTNAQLPMPGHKLNCGATLEEPCPPLTVTEARSHFGAWAIVSSPLILGLNLTDVAEVQKHWETITNRDAIEVNQDYAGFSGSLFAQSEEMDTFTPCDWGLAHGASNASCVWPVSWSWFKPLSGRDARGSIMAILLVNNGHAARRLGFEYADVPGLKVSSLQGCLLYDVWARTSIGRGALGNKGWQSARPVEPHDSIFLTLSSCE